MDGQMLAGYRSEGVGLAASGRGWQFGHLWLTSCCWLQPTSHRRCDGCAAVVTRQTLLATCAAVTGRRTEFPKPLLVPTHLHGTSATVCTEYQVSLRWHFTTGRE